MNYFHKTRFPEFLSKLTPYCVYHKKYSHLFLIHDEKYKFFLILNLQKKCHVSVYHNDQEQLQRLFYKWWNMNFFNILTIESNWVIFNAPWFRSTNYYWSLTQKQSLIIIESRLQLPKASSSIVFNFRILWKSFWLKS